MPSGKLTQTQYLTGGINTGNHKTLVNRDAADQHPMRAITGLLEALNSDTDKISAVEEKIDSEANRAIQNEQKLAEAIDNSINTAKTLVETEKTRAENVEKSILADIANVRIEISSGDENIAKLVAQETARAEAKEAEIEKIAKEALENTEHFEDIIFPLKKAIADETENRIKRDNDIISDFTAKNYQVNKRIEQEITDRTQADDVLDKKIDELTNYIDEHVKDLRIEDITKTTKLETRAESGYYLADEFIANVNYYEKVELARSKISQENIDIQSEYIPVKINEKNFVKNKYYVYRTSTSKDHEPVYRIARFFDPNKKYYQYSYGTDDTTGVGM